MPKSSKTDTTDDSVLNQIFQRLDVMDKMNSNISEIKERFDEFEKRFDKLEEEIKEHGESLKDQRSELVKHDGRVTSLEQRVYNLERKSLETTIIFTGVNLPTTESKSLAERLRDFLIKCKINVLISEIVNAYKITTPTPRGPTTKYVLQMQTVSQKIGILSQRKRLRDEFNPSIYVNEYLTKSAAETFKKARELRSSGKITSTWTKNGSVYIKTESQGKETVTLVESKGHLQNLVK